MDVELLQHRRSCQYSCSILDCFVPPAVCTHVLYTDNDCTIVSGSAKDLTSVRNIFRILSTTNPQTQSGVWRSHDNLKLSLYHSSI